jgi:hypothetical protein
MYQSFRQRAQERVRDYITQWEYDTEGSSGVEFLLTDILHYCDNNGLNFVGLLQEAQELASAEIWVDQKVTQGNEKTVDT